MSHQHFEELIFREDELSTQEAGALQEHLEKCASCNQLALSNHAVETHLKTAAMIAPAPHFVNRWQARLENEYRRSINRQNRFMVILSWSAVFVFLGALLYLAWPMLQTPKVVVLTYLYQLLGIVSLVNETQNLTSGLFDGLSGGIPVIWLVLLVGVLTQIGVIWVVSYRYLTNPRRVLR